MIAETKFDKYWTLFLDRDGVINVKRDNDYVKNWDEFDFIKGSLEALSILSQLFNNIIIVTNQRGIGRGLMSIDDLNLIHELMFDEVISNNGRLDKVYFCPDVDESSIYRKPNTGMAELAKIENKSIDFNKSIMIGDSDSDMIFGSSLGMKCFFIGNPDKVISKEIVAFESLLELALHFEKSRGEFQIKN